MKIKVAILVTNRTYPHLFAEKYANELGIEIIKSEHYFNEAIEIGKALETNGVKAIISQGATVKYLSDNLNIPIVSLDVSTADIIYQIFKFMNNNQNINRIGMIIPSPKEVEYKKINELLKIEIIPYYYSKKEDIYSLLEIMNGLVTEVITFSAVIKDIIIKDGFNPILITPGKETIKNCLTKAKELVVEREKEKEYASRLNSIINISNTGIINIDQNNVIRIFNRIAEDILKIKRNEIINKSVNEIEQIDLEIAEFIKKVLTFSKPSLIKIRKHKILAYYLLIDGDLENYGAIIAFERISNIEKMETNIRVQTHTKGLEAKFSFYDIIGETDLIKQTIETAKFFAKTDSTVLISGESGCGKELFAQSIHNGNEKIKKGPFVAINCAALPENLLESELFGYEEGAFTGAKKGGKIGLFELAHKGTIFLDEIAEMPIRLQAHLLRVLEEKEVMRIGSNNVIPVDVRIVAATNKNLKIEVNENRFRKDLFYRLNVLNINIPPLRERKADIPILANVLFKNEIAKYIQKNIVYRDDIFIILKKYDWPGNVRELKNFIERLTILYINTNTLLEILIERMVGQLNEEKQIIDSTTLLSNDRNTILINIDTLENMEKEIITKLSAKFNKNELVKTLGVDRTTIWRKLKSYLEEY